MIKYFLIVVFLTSCVTVTHNHYAQPVKRDTVYLPCKQLHFGLSNDTVRHNQWRWFPGITTPYIYDTTYITQPFFRGGLQNILNTDTVKVKK